MIRYGAQPIQGASRAAVAAVTRRHTSDMLGTKGGMPRRFEQPQRRHPCANLVQTTASGELQLSHSTQETPPPPPRERAGWSRREMLHTSANRKRHQQTVRTENQFCAAEGVNAGQCKKISGGCTADQPFQERQPILACSSVTPSASSIKTLQPE